jgi:thimet oligopeptidase
MEDPTVAGTSALEAATDLDKADGVQPRSILAFALVTLIGACGADPPPSPAAPTTIAPPAPPPASSEIAAPMPAKPKLAPLDVDPVERGLSQDGIVALCDESLARASALLDEIRKMKGASDDALTWDSTLGKLDAATLAVRNGSDFPQLLAVAHPDKAVRDGAKSCEPKVEKFQTALYLDQDLATVFKRYAAKKERLSGPRARLLAHTLRDYRRNGLDLDAAGRTKLRDLNERITKLGQDFETNIAESTLSIEVTPADLEGLPPSYIDGHKPAANGKVTITTDYPDYFPFLQYAKNRAAALELYKKFDNRAAEKNVALLEQLLSLRDEKAKLLGYKTWADYVLEPRMAKTSDAVARFLEGLRTHLAKKGKEEFKELEAMHQKLGGKRSDPLPLSDRTYLEDQVRKAKYGLDSQEVSKYFEVTDVKKGILEITSKLFGISYRPAALPKWHEEVEGMEVLDGAGKVIGRFYFDLYPRADKYKHAAVFSIRETKKMEDGSRLLPVAAIVCNFPRPSAGGPPALMGHAEVTTFFHEFGHVLHHLLSESELASFAGTSVARDFVESPSQMLEEWAWSKETLDMFARHHETKKPIPEKLVSTMQRSRAFGRALMTQRQLFLAALDQTYHTRSPGFDTTKVMAEIHHAYLPFSFVEGTHFQATFGHLVGYDAGYYGYQWALSIARDLFTRFEKEGMMNPKTATEYRAAILSAGGSDDEAALVQRFLGRPPSDEAYKRYLGHLRSGEGSRLQAPGSRLQGRGQGREDRVNVCGLAPSPEPGAWSPPPLAQPASVGWTR